MSAFANARHMSSDSLHALIRQDVAGRAAQRDEQRASLKQRLELTEIFSELRGSMVDSLGAKTYYDDARQHEREFALQQEWRQEEMRAEESAWYDARGASEWHLDARDRDEFSHGLGEIDAS